MYWPPESGNIEPSSAKATQAHSEITPPKTHTRKNQSGCGRGPAISLAVRNIDEPIMPLTSKSTESSRLRPRMRLAGGLDVSDCGTWKTGVEGISYPMPSSSDDSSGVPQRRQMMAEQSRQVSGSPTSTAHSGQ